MPLLWGKAQKQHDSNRSNGSCIAHCQDIFVKSGFDDVVYIIDVESEDSYTLPMRFEGIFSVNWNPKNNSIVLRGDNAKQSDIYVYNLKTKKLEQITNDLFTDINPTWSVDGNKIFFTSDRGNYTDLKNIPHNLKMINFDYTEKDLYVYDMNTRELSKFAGTKNAEEYNAVTSADGKKILYISDRNGINNIWMRDNETGAEKPVTNSRAPPTTLPSRSAPGANTP